MEPFLMLCSTGMGWDGQMEAKIPHLPEFDRLLNLCQYLKYQEASV